MQSRVQSQDTFLSYVLWHLLGQLRPDITVTSYILLTISNVNCEWNREMKRKMSAPPHIPPPTLDLKVVNNECLIPGALTSEVTESWLHSHRTGQGRPPFSPETAGLTTEEVRWETTKLEIVSDAADSGNCLSGSGSTKIYKNLSAHRNPRAHTLLRWIKHPRGYIWIPACMCTLLSCLNFFSPCACTT